MLLKLKYWVTTFALIYRCVCVHSFISPEGKHLALKTATHPSPATADNEYIYSAYTHIVKWLNQHFFPLMWVMWLICSFQIPQNHKIYNII